MGGQQIHAAVLHGTGQTPRYEPFPAPVAGDDQAVVAAGEIVVDLDPVPLADVEHAWPRAGSDRRVIFVP